MTQLVAKLDKVTTSGDTYTATVSAEVEKLILSTGEKYEAAEKSSENLARPATTAGLFVFSISLLNHRFIIVSHKIYCLWCLSSSTVSVIYESPE